MKRQLTYVETVERSLMKTYRKEIYSPFMKALRDFQMIEENDHIAVCISGGKDSFLLAKCFQLIQRYGNIPFQLSFISMDPGYEEANYNKIVENAKKLEIPLHIFKAPIFDYVTTIEDSPCYLCARMRRGYLYKEAKALGCNKIALGHHFNDVIETNLMGMIYGAQIQTMMPKLHSTHFEGMELIRPLYYVREHHIQCWVRHNELEFIACACALTKKQNEEEKAVGKRAKMKELVKELMKENQHVEDNIFRSMFDINLNTVIGYHDDQGSHNFLDTYKDKEIILRGESKWKN
ncbi:MAG: tRNA 2-thiocytidine biosynthesis protein TtcA [Erysipelotrichaceae bacterium]|nr:tRNA 2-thiocytidine biosynthesis protein TtcA [Erysipelotrichaceae bacterium]MBR3694194.1 tRNA 2-thiocytidine biosynthesis protein TtcA [Erysipelotrichales bacterium]